jgi:hypothetical protein
MLAIRPDPSAPIVMLVPGAANRKQEMSAAFRFDPVELPLEREALRAEVASSSPGSFRRVVGAEPSISGSHCSAAFGQRLGGRGCIGMTWPKRYGGGQGSILGPADIRDCHRSDAKGRG